jgi:hypothetical protein
MLTLMASIKSRGSMITAKFIVLLLLFMKTNLGTSYEEFPEFYVLNQGGFECDFFLTLHNGGDAE